MARYRLEQFQVDHSRASRQVNPHAGDSENAIKAAQIAHA
jgi:hypothetical protein